MAGKRIRPSYSYKRAVEFIAMNDDPENRDVESVAGYISTITAAVGFGKDNMQVARDVVAFREKHGEAS